MASSRRVSRWHRPRVAVLTAVAAGTLFGLAGFFTKIAVAELTVGVSLFITLVLNPFAWFATISGIAGFFLLQWTLHRGKISLVTPIITGISIIVPVMLALVFLGETISQLKWVGIVLILIGAVGLNRP